MHQFCYGFTGGRQKTASQNVSILERRFGDMEIDSLVGYSVSIDAHVDL